ncbi:hypothetical protein THAOC_05740 [Thalassiosira oceanica]|uniref:RxLR effector protein n=1 Tax=Thalassiosira oceanica TaxID=159749 RepID=K0T508_THAOC|nr:hypothetical protein THAOC_05740 [Thalassiosira oceanica]|eukprot:EJK72700.1 hypothetical protein THAOC_05740 [Thalassiosira oceanica]
MKTSRATIQAAACLFTATAMATGMINEKQANEGIQEAAIFREHVKDLREKTNAELRSKFAPSAKNSTHYKSTALAEIISKSPHVINSTVLAEKESDSGEVEHDGFIKDRDRW